MKAKKNKSTPNSLKNRSQWLANRRSFLKTLMIGTAATQIPWWVSCTHKGNKNEQFVLNKKQIETLLIVQDFLFPADGNGPGATDLKATDYLQWVVLDPEMDALEVEYIFNGIDWVEETAQEEKNQEFLALSPKNQEALLTYITSRPWGESWFSVLITFILEALLADPIYGSNQEPIGWEWLEHNPGYPRPNDQQKYGQFLFNVNSKQQKHG